MAVLPAPIVEPVAAVASALVALVISTDYREIDWSICRAVVDYVQPFQWSEACQKAFDDLIQVFTTGLVLAHLDSARETWIETDSSDFVSAGVLSQMHSDVLKPVAYFSKKMLPAEGNYMIYG